MKFNWPQWRLFFSVCVIALGVLFLTQAPSASSSARTVHFIQLEDDTINPVTAEYIIDAIANAYEQNAEALVIKLDTPGGLLSSTRLIVKNILTAKIPVVVYIAPNGSRAGSAGVFITYASNVAVMAPSTNIGAAHPVQMGGGKAPKQGEWEELRKLIDDLKNSATQKSDSKEESAADEKANEKPEGTYTSDENPLESKILNDTLAFIRSIAEERNRNVEWAQESVANSASITAEEALEKGVVEFIAQNDKDLLEQIDGAVVEVNGEEVTLQTRDAAIEYRKMDVRQKLFNILANPNIAYFLLILGFYGLLYEITHPGLGVPGVMGLMFLILAFYSMQTLPVDYAGVALIGLGIILLISEAFIPGFGLLVLGGSVCLILGSMMLFKSADPVMRVSKIVIFSLSITLSVLTFFLVKTIYKYRHAKAQGGQEGLIGLTAEVQSTISPESPGKVYVHGEIWNAQSDQKIKKGEKVQVTHVDGLTLTVSLKTREEA